MQLNSEYTTKIEKMLYEGKSLAKVEDFSVFVLGGCPKDVVKIRIIKINKSYALGEIVEIIEPSGFRVKPVCPMHSVCGSCNWQYIDYSEQLRQKQNIVRETLKTITKKDFVVEDVIPSPKITEYRCKVQYPVSRTEVSKRLITGYYKLNSHNLVNIKYCPMQPEIINKINEFIKISARDLNISGYKEKTHSGLLRHIIYRISSDLSQILVIFVINSEEIPQSLKKLADIVKENFEQICGVCVNINTSKSNVIAGKKTKALTGVDFYIENLNGFKFKISAGSFFQVNPYCAVKMFDTVKDLIMSVTDKPTLLDAYSGVSSFGIWLHSAASKVVCVEEAVSSTRDAAENIKLNSADNIKVINSDASVQFEKMIKEGVKFDVIVIDPPRKGCSDSAIEYLVKLCSSCIVYVSCNPATLARDLCKIMAYGFSVKKIIPVDMFPNTYHIETVVLLTKDK